MAHAQGLRAWLLQRISAVYMVVYLIFLLLRLVLKSPQGYAEWRGFITAPIMAAPTALLFFLLLMHAWVGMRDVVMDYVHDFKVRVTVLSVIAAGLLAMGSWAVLVLTRAS
jgi:succinate dehydrogenase membrane anchor subunit